MVGPFDPCIFDYVPHNFARYDCVPNDGAPHGRVPHDQKDP